MNRVRSLLVLAAAVLCPIPAAAQPTILVGVGLTSPLGDFADQASNGYHGALGLDVGVPAIPVSLRLSGAYHGMGAATTAFEDATVLSGSLDFVFALPSVGPEPYLLFGVGRYRIDAGAIGASVRRFDRAYHAGFGINLGAAGFGSYVEIRYQRLVDPAGSRSMVPVTFGLRM